jgi:arabinofuranosyltransferase
VVLVLLLASRAFGDYSTSGLETPLSALLLVWLAWLDDRPGAGARRLLVVALVTALLGTTRLDLIVLAGPVLLAHLRGVRPGDAVGALGVGLLPLWLWSAFALFYYGSPFPITAYAKAFANDVPKMDLLQQGFCYFGYSLRHDPATLATIGAGLVVGFVAPAVRGRMLALGVLCYLVYVVRVGGDFMAGRFFVPPLVVTIALLARWLRDAARAPRVLVAVAAIGLACVGGVPPYLRPIADELVPLAREDGIDDERRFYFVRAGLWSPQHETPVAGDGSRRLREDGRTAPLVVKYDVAGRDPFVAGELFHVVDRWILDPLLMRLPVLGEWRIGHFTRGIPEGYLESLAHGGNRIVHPGLRAYYDDLRLVLRAPLWQGERLAALWRLSTGADAAGLRAYVAEQYHARPRRELDAEQLPPPVTEGTFWFDEPGVVLVGAGGLGIDFGAPVQARSLRVSLAVQEQYRFTFFAAGQRVGEVELDAVAVAAPPPGTTGLLGYLRTVMGQRDYVLALPAAARTFDRCEVDCIREPRLVPALGGLERLP